MHGTGLAVAHGNRVERPRGAARQRARTARRRRGRGIPGQRQHLRYAKREPDRLRRRGLASRRVPHHVTVPRHDHLDRAGTVRQRAAGGGGRDGVDAELRPGARRVTRLAGEQAEHDVSGRAGALGTAGRGRRRLGVIGGAWLLRVTRRVGEPRRCRGRGSGRGSGHGGSRRASRPGNWPRAPVRGRGQRLAAGERGDGRPGRGGRARRRRVRAGEHPGAHSERDDPGAQDKEPPPPEGPVRPQVPPLVTRPAVVVAGHLFVTVRIHPHANSMRVVTLSTQ